MSKGWPTKTLQTLCEDVNVGHVGPSSMHREPGGISFLMGKNVGTGVIYTHNIERVTEAFHRSQPKSRLRPGDIVVVRIGKSGQASKIPEGFGEANCSGLVVIKQPHGIHPDFLVYYLNSPIGRGYSLSQARGSTRLTLNTRSVAETLVPVPPFPEQQRIVGILDEAFDGLARATANAEQNLRNARALFESHLHLEHVEKAMLGDLVNVKTGKLDANAAVEGGKFPFFTCSRDIFEIDTYAFDCEAILLAGNNAVGDFNVKHYKGKFNAYQRTYVITVNERQQVLYRFLYFQMLKSLKKFKSQSVGAGTKFLKLGMIKELEIELPTLEEQQRIVSTMDSMREETQRLESIYQQKLAALAELKKSLLHEAFSGKL